VANDEDLTNRVEPVQRLEVALEQVAEELGRADDGE
jgi:hypothetical protein